MAGMKAIRIAMMLLLLCPGCHIRRVAVEAGTWLWSARVCIEDVQFHESTKQVTPSQE